MQSGPGCRRHRLGSVMYVMSVLPVLQTYAHTVFRRLSNSRRCQGMQADHGERPVSVVSSIMLVACVDQH